MNEDVRATESEIFVRLTRAAKERNVVLTYANKLFFLRLLDLGMQVGEVTDEGVSVSLSVQELSDNLQIPLKTSMQSLNRLAECEVLLRSDEERTFPRSAKVTTILKSFYEERSAVE